MKENINFTLAKGRILYLLDTKNKVTKKDMLIQVRKAYEHLKNYEDSLK